MTEMNLCKWTPKTSPNKLKAQTKEMKTDDEPNEWMSIDFLPVSFFFFCVLRCQLQMFEMLSFMMFFGNKISQFKSFYVEQTLAALDREMSRIASNNWKAFIGAPLLDVSSMNDTHVNWERVREGLGQGWAKRWSTFSPSHIFIASD